MVTMGKFLRALVSDFMTRPLEPSRAADGGRGVVMAL
jgi:hypothetical protein